MADVIDYKIYGDDMQVVEIELDPGEGVRAEAGAMMYMDENIQMQTSTGGGLFKGFKRMLTGESFFITTFMNNGKGKELNAFGAPIQAKSFLWIYGSLLVNFYVKKDAFMCSLGN